MVWKPRIRLGAAWGFATLAAILLFDTWCVQHIRTAPIDLTLFCRDQSSNRIDDYLELFHTDLTFYSYEYGFAKPNPLLFRKLYDALYEFQILPSQTVFVGNDLVNDIKPAADAGMLTAFFTGDDQTAFVHDQDGMIVPDISFSSWEELPEKLSFYEKKDA